MKNIEAAILVIVGAMLLPAAASAGTKDDVRALQAQMAQVQQQLAAHREALVKISQLERQNQLLTGRLEELSHELDQANRRLESISAALAGDGTMGSADGELSGPRDFGSSPSGGPVDLTGRNAPAAGDDPIADQIAGQTRDPGGDSVGGGDVSLPLDPEAAFDYASQFILAGDYQRAKAAFTLYLEAFPNHSRTPDAQFRLGEIHLALEENAAAADAFIAHIRNYPNNGRSAEAYLKLGTAFARLDKPTEACTVFKTMKSKHPNAPRAVLQRADLEMARIDCQ